MMTLKAYPDEQFNSPVKEEVGVSIVRKWAGFLLALLLGLGTVTSILVATDAKAQSSTGELKVISENIEAGIKETRFDIEVDGIVVPGIFPLWQDS